MDGEDGEDEAVGEDEGEDGGEKEAEEDDDAHVEEKEIGDAEKEEVVPESDAGGECFYYYYTETYLRLMWFSRCGSGREYRG
jgi:hypothetical protein